MRTQIFPFLKWWGEKTISYKIWRIFSVGNLNNNFSKYYRGQTKYCITKAGCRHGLQSPFTVPSPLLSTLKNTEWAEQQACWQKTPRGSRTSVCPQMPGIRVWMWRREGTGRPGQEGFIQEETLELDCVNKEESKPFWAEEEQFWIFGKG